MREQISPEAAPSNGLAIVRNGHRTLLKWHRARKYAADTAFTGRRILEGLVLGASVEVDLVRHGGGGFAVLHDETLDRETNGTGPLATAQPGELAKLYLRDNAGRVGDEPLMLLETLCTLLADIEPHPEARLQLDMKTPAHAFSADDIAAFARAVTPVAPTMILSAGDTEAVARLAEAVPAMRIGFDPCHSGAIERLQASRDFARFIADALAASHGAETIYLAHELILLADKAGFDMISAFHGAGRTVDAYTLKTADAATAPVLARLLALKADQITTDDPVGMQALAQTLS